MFKSILFIYFYSLVTSYAKFAPFIDPCKWDDKKCLISSSQKALPYVANGVADLGLSTLDPMPTDTTTVNEAGLNIEFKNMKIERLKECIVRDVQRNIQDHWLSLELECPIYIHGHYTVSGKLFFLDIQGNGPFYIKSEKLFISVKMGLKTVNNYWKIGKYEYTFDFKKKADLNFENLFNGDKEKATPVLTILDQQWKEVVKKFGGPIVGKAVNKVMVEFSKITKEVPANELEL